MRYLIKKPDTFLNSLNNEINTILHRSFDSIFPEYAFHKEIEGLTMPVDVKEYNDKYKIKVEVPGVKKEDIQVDINKSYVVISAQKTQEKEEKGLNFHKSELRYGDFSRTVYYPQEVDVSRATAELKHGVLCLDLPKLYKEDTKDFKRLEVKD